MTSPRGTQRGSPSATASIVGAAIGAAQTELFHPRPGVTPEPLDLPGPVHDRT